VDEELLALKDLADRTHHSRWSVRRWMRRYPDFPRPIYLNVTRPRWLASEFNAWLLSRRKDGERP
jgi:predicted DNA-binding transcriptional regulator AlpA